MIFKNYLMQSNKFIVMIFFFSCMLLTMHLLGQEKPVEGKKPKKVKVRNKDKNDVSDSLVIAKKHNKQNNKQNKKKKQKPVRPLIKPKIPPPGTVWVNDTLYIDVNPVTNIEYREFLSFLVYTYSKKVRDSLDNIPLFGLNHDNFRSFMQKEGPDYEFYQLMKIPYHHLLSWAQSLDEYLTSPIFNDNPVIYVTYQQAQEYCLWRTRVVMLLWATKSKNQKQRNKYYTRIRYRLPTPEEWDLVIEKFKDNIFTNKAILPYNIACTYPVIPQRRKLKFYYMPGNVAEMTSEENIAVGISWKDTDSTDNYTKRVSYLGARDWLGFRCVCQILEY